MVNKELLASLSGGLFFLSKSMGQTPHDFIFGARYFKLQNEDMVTSYLSSLNAEERNPEIFGDDFHDEATLNALRPCREKDLFVFLETLLKDRIGNSQYIADHLSDWISFFYDDAAIVEPFYVCNSLRCYGQSTEPKEYQCGREFFFRHGEEVLVVSFKAEGRDFEFSI